MSGPYSFQDVHATIAGPGGGFNLGFGAAIAEEGISTDMVEDKNTMTIGADGEGMHSLHAGNAGVVTVRTLQTSPVNQLLMSLYDAQKQSSTLWGQNMIVIRQTASGDITTANQCAFKKRPSLPYKKVGAFLEWAFDCIKIETKLGQY